MPRIFTSDFHESTGENPYVSGSYRPILLLSYAIDYAVLGLRPLGFHLTSNFLHAFNACLFYWLASIVLQPGLALALGFLFSLHPVVVESVALIGNRADLLVGTFAILHVISLLKFTSVPCSKSTRWAAVYLLSIPAGLFAKESFFFIPFGALLGVSICYPIPVVRKRIVKIALGAVLVSVVCVLWRSYVTTGFSTRFLGFSFLRDFAEIVFRYIQVLVLPAETDFFFSYAASDALTDVQVWGIIFACVFILLLVCRSAQRLGAAIGFFLWITPLLPAAGAKHFIDTIGERWFYLSHAGFCLLLGAALGTWIREFKVSYVAISLAFLSLLTVLTVRRNMEVKSEISFYQSSIERDATNYRPYFQLTKYFRRVGDIKEEIRYLRGTLRQNPRFVPALNGLAVRMIDDNRLDEARTLLRRAYAIDRNRTATLFNVGYYYETKANSSKALDWYLRAAKTRPDSAAIHAAIGRMNQKLRSSNSVSTELKRR
ncbi:MAG TPA: hypothetical protein VI895_10625 [Bdellovibrionota bacterium]|nr:hypothetical protein [Bdellovibrionota bacterium]